MTLKSTLLATIAAISLASFAYADNHGDKDKDKDEAEKWDVMNPPGPKTMIDIDVTEGTWMSLDVSPDGKTLAFDLLGDIYTLPVTGGTATNIASGMAWEMQPRFSPDGSRLAFISDRAGGDNIWTMDVDGSDMEQVTKETFRLLNNPTWHPSGDFIAGRKHFTTSRSLGVGEIWLYSTQGGSGVQLVKKPSEAHQKELGEPMFTPDGSAIYYSQNTTPGPIFEYAQDSHGELFQIKKYDMDTGDISTVAGGFGGAVRPTPSPDGKHLAFVKRVDAETRLFIKDLESGEEREVFDHLDRDMQETWAVHGVYPNMDWSPDSKHLYFWASGQIHKLDVATKEVDHIDFRVKDTREMRTAPRPKVAVAPDTFKTTMPRFVQVSPDGSRVIYESLGKLYTKATSGGRAKRLTKLPADMKEMHPRFSRDGKSLTFVTWNDSDLGAIHTMDLKSNKITTLTETPGHYANPALSPSGEFLTYEKRSGGFLTAPEWSADTGVYIQAVDGGEPVRVSKSGSMPHFGSDDLRLFMTKNEDDMNALVSVNLLGHDARTHASSKMAQSYHVSMDGKHVAFRENYNLYSMPLLSGPQNVTAGMKADALPVTKLSLNGATYPSWTQDGDIYWSLGPNVFKADPSAKEQPESPASVASLSRTIKKDMPDGMVALTNAKIISMSNAKGGIIEKGTILIEGDRIKAMGANVSIPRGAEVVDLDGKTIVPGFVDAHAHGPQGVGDLVPQQNWKTVATLALGVTTVFDPSTRADSFFPAQELQRTGKLLAPRLFSTGEVIYGAKAPGFFANIQSFDDAQEHVTRLKEQGAHGVKNYNQPRRDQRQQVVEAARKEDMIVVAEGGSLFHMDMALVQDGNTSLEHNLPQEYIYDDVVQMFAQTNVAYVPTLAVTYGGIRGEDYYYQESDVSQHPVLSKHVPPAALRARAKRRQMAPIKDYADGQSGATSKQLADAGVMVAIGAHGQREGLAAHWEMWSFARGGMSPLQALSTATVLPAQHLGFFDDIGSLEAGKLADLVILDKDPTEDIRNTDSVEHVMIGGRLYEADTMNEIVTGDTKRLPYWWEE
ncbi:amidohydrolase family protein [Litorimonas sp. RW-G-Af-16]|uniref:amidohydrolase family protein n=1 Tax=Litorimonas sp. RW-G-Af-16 TaxID=3241168 RepID=UPI00390C6DFC